jgi:N-methylhydantoinase A
VTVTDAYVTLGIIEPRRFLGGSAPLDPALAERAVAALAQRLGKSVVETAESVLRVATSQMYAALVPLMARKAINLDEFALLPFGGAGPTHGFLLAREVGIRRVIVPPSPGVLCAIGSLVADVRRDFVRTIHRPLRRTGDGDLLPALREGFGALTREGQRWLDAQNLTYTDTRHEWSLDIRYLGQSFELTVPVGAALLDDGRGEALRTAFHDTYRGVYGYADDGAELEILTLRTTSIGVTAKPAMPRIGVASASRPSSGAHGERRVFLDGAFHSARVMERSGLAAGLLGDGPMVIEQYDTTVLVPAGFTVRVDELGNLIGEATHGYR